ncbi:MAG TPA: hypothetical protein G4O08_08095 [Anaerolineae bacterium]|nr:hypothetical protein [Anaerolineae bacterium]
MRAARMILLGVLAILVISCAITPPTTFPTSTASPTETNTPPSPPDDNRTPIVIVPETPVETVEPTPDRPDEAILILFPGPGSIVTSPVTVSGIADPTFEQTLVVRILLTDNTVLALEPTIIQADLGERGRYSVDVPFQVESTTQGFIQVFAESARDGGITHLSTMGVALAPSGPETIVPGQFLPEQIWIQSPVLGQTVSGGVVRVQGFALASFEQTLVIDVYDASGNLVGSKPTMTHAPDLGLPGPFDDTVSYIVGSTGPGRIVVRDPSVAFVGDYHIASVEITLEP